MSEPLHEEFLRLVDAYQNGSRQNRIEAWNMIADFAVENKDRIYGMLRAKDEDERWGKF